MDLLENRCDRRMRNRETESFEWMKSFSQGKGKRKTGNSFFLLNSKVILPGIVISLIHPLFV